MRRQVHAIGRLTVLGVALALAVAAAAQQPDATPGPTKKDPLRFSAFAVSMQGGRAGVVDIVIERWTPDDERKALLDVLAGASFKAGGQDKLLDALQKVEPRTGFIRTPNSLGWDLKYARENLLPDGTRQIVIATDKRVGFLAAASASRILDYPFTFIEMRMKPDGKGEGRLLAATAIDIKNGRLELEHYGQEPVRLTTITQQKKKTKK